MLKCLIFDFDGVIIDSIKVQEFAYYESCRRVLGENTDIPPFAEYMSHTGDSLHNIFRKMNLPQELVPIYRRLSSENIDKIVVVEDVVRYIKQAKAMGLFIGLCTGKDRVRTIEILKRYDMSDVFDVVICSDDVKNPKPHPESLAMIMEKLNVSVDECVMIGDGENDMLAAQNINMIAILSQWCDGAAPVKIKYNYSAKNVQDLENIIKQLMA